MRAGGRAGDRIEPCCFPIRARRRSLHQAAQLVQVAEREEDVVHGDVGSDGGRDVGERPASVQEGDETRIRFALQDQLAVLVEQEELTRAGRDDVEGPSESRSREHPWIFAARRQGRWRGHGAGFSPQAMSPTMSTNAPGVPRKRS